MPGVDGVRECDNCCETAIAYCNDHELHACKACMANHENALHRERTISLRQKAHELTDLDEMDDQSLTSWEVMFIQSLRQFGEGARFSELQAAKIVELWDKLCK
jgi:hypothetical protein